MIGHIILAVSSLDADNFSFWSDIIAFLALCLFNLAFFFQLFILNIIWYSRVLIVYGLEVLKDDLEKYSKSHTLVMSYLLIGEFLESFKIWRKKIERRNFSDITEKILLTLTFFSCAFMTFIAFFPQCLLCNITFIIILALIKKDFKELDKDIEGAFGFQYLE